MVFKHIIKNFNIDEKKPKELAKALMELKDKKYYKKFYEKNLKLTKESIKNSINEDQLIIQTISNIVELDRLGNQLTRRLREWYGLYYPELKIEDNKKFADSVIKNKRTKSEMGADLNITDVNEMQLLAKQIISLYELRNKHEKYLEKVMKKYCPNLLALAGVTIGAQLIDLGRGLKHLALLPASTIQLLGAEKALFRHLKTKSKSPKYGVLFEHQLVQRAKRNEKGKAARMLADKLSLCARLDFFKGEFRALEYKKELEDKLDIQPTGPLVRCG